MMCRIQKELFLLISIFLLFPGGSIWATEEFSDYTLVYDQLYQYGEDSSGVLQKYLELKVKNQNVILIQADQITKETIDKKSKVLIVASSFDSLKKYNQVRDTLNKLHTTIIEDVAVKDGKKGLMIAIDEVYPFSDLNHVMDMGEVLQDRGIEFIVTIMPVYENYDLPAFDKYIEVLKYMSHIGGKLFIHYPIENQEGTYNKDLQAAFEKSIRKYRDRGLEIIGVTLSQEKLFTGPKVFDGLDVPFMLITEKGKKIDSDTNLYNISQGINKYILIEGMNANTVDLFQLLREQSYFGQKAICFTEYQEDQEIIPFLKLLNSYRVPIGDFIIDDYEDKLQRFTYTETTNEEGKSKENPSELEDFLKKEYKKIKGENIEQKQSDEGYDISWFSKVGIKVAFILLILLILQVGIGRRFDIRKFFRK